MPRQKPADKVEALRRQRAEIATKLKEAETKAREKKRDDDQRRERLAGRCILAQLDREPDSEWGRITRALLARSVTRASDQSLFPGLLSDSGQSISSKTAREPQEEVLPDET